MLQLCTGTLSPLRTDKAGGNRNDPALVDRREYRRGRVPILQHLSAGSASLASVVSTAASEGPLEHIASSALFTFLFSKSVELIKLKIC